MTTARLELDHVTGTPPGRPRRRRRPGRGPGGGTVTAAAERCRALMAVSRCRRRCHGRRRRRRRRRYRCPASTPLKLLAGPLRRRPGPGRRRPDSHGVRVSLPASGGRARPQVVPSRAPARGPGRRGDRPPGGRGGPASRHSAPLQAPAIRPVRPGPLEDSDLKGGGSAAVTAGLSESESDSAVTETCSSFLPGRRSRFRLQAVSRIRIWIQNLECLQAKCTLWLFQCALMGGDMDQLSLWTERKIGQAVI